MRRQDILASRSKIETWIAERRTKAWICGELECRPATLENALRALNLSYAGNPGRANIARHNERRPVDQYLVRGSTINSHPLKQRLFRDGLKARSCEECGLSVWRGRPIPLELHHVDGDRRNNTIENLQILCSNCHALTDNNAGRRRTGANPESLSYPPEGGYIVPLALARLVKRQTRSA